MTSGGGDKNGVEARDFALEQAKRRRLALVDSLLAPTCLESLEVLFDWSNWAWTDSEPPAHPLLAAAGQRVFGCLQAELRARAPGPLDSAAGFELAYAQEWARHGMLEQAITPEVKAWELEVTDGEPLTICVGGLIKTKWEPAPGQPYMWAIELGKPTPFAFDGESGQIPVYGCFRVISDSTTGTGKSTWKHSCPNCEASSRLPRKMANRHAKYWRTLRRT